MFKVFIKQFKDDKYVGTACLCKDYEKLQSAIKAGDKNKLSDKSQVRIREYDDNKSNIISDDAQDTGTIIIDY